MSKTEDTLAFPDIDRVAADDAFASTARAPRARVHPVESLSTRPELLVRRAAPARGKPRADKRHRQGKPLTPAQELFVARYMVRMNATRAYQDSYPNAAYSTARTEGSRLFHDPRIALEIRRSVAEAKKRLMRSANRVLDETAALAFSSLSDVFDGSGTIIPPNDLPRDVAVAVKKLKRQEILGAVDEETGQRKILGHMVELEMHDKVGPLKLLGQHFGIFEEKPPPTSPGKDFAAILEAASQRVLDGLRGRLIEGEKVK